MQNRLADIVEQLGAPRMLVLGDLILDRYVWGDAERISQEAPVILLRADSREERLGGAASVATLLKALGAEVMLAGVLGADESGTRTRELLSEQGIDHHLVLEDRSRPSTLKERYMGKAQHRHAQQMMRVDYEVRTPISEELQEQLAAKMEASLIDVDIVLVSDYDKGVCTPTLTRRLIEACRDRKIKVIVDPIRGGDYVERYRGATAMTPNRLEASLASGVTIKSIDDAFEAARILKQKVGMEVGLVTLDREGMVLINHANEPLHYPVREREVYDITGAGDMVLATLGMIIARGHQFEQAIPIANSAGGLEVEKVGVATVSRAELIHDLRLHEAAPLGKIVDQDELRQVVEMYRRQGKTIAFTNGCFDILHAGHIAYLRESAAQADVLIVGLNSDDSVRRLGKGTDRPINTVALRAEVLSELQSVDHLCVFDTDTPIELIELVRPDVLVKGSDYRPEEVVGRDFVESIGGRLHLASFVPNLSTTKTLSRLRSQAA